MKDGFHILWVLLAWFCALRRFIHGGGYFEGKKMDLSL